MSLALATKGILASGGGPGSPYPVTEYVEKVGDVAVSVEMEADVLISLEAEDIALTVALDEEQVISSDSDGEIAIQVEVTDDELRIEVE